MSKDFDDPLTNGWMCGVSWGKFIDGGYQHTCWRNKGHDGPHQCVTGAKYGGKGYVFGKDLTHWENEK